MANNSKEKQKEYDAKRAGQRGRNFNFVAYPDDLPENWTEMLDNTRIRWIEGPLHDRDQWTVEDEQENPEHKAGEYKKPHKHCLAMFDSVKSVKNVVEFLKGLFGESDSGSIPGIPTPELTADRSGSVRYMAHLDNPTKAQYDVADIIGHNGADPQEIIRFSLSEQLSKMRDMEDYIEKHNICYLTDFSSQIRAERPDWYQILATKNTYYFNAVIRSIREKNNDCKYNKKYDMNTLLSNAIDRGMIYIDADTGELKVKDN